MLAGLFVGAAIPAVPYPCLMLAAHSAGFTAGGLLSMIAGALAEFLTLQASPRSVGAQALRRYHELARRRRRSEAARLTSEV